MKKGIRVWMVACFIAGAAASGLAQEKPLEVNYGPGQYGAYRKQLLEFAERAQELLVRIRGLYVKSEYCNAEDRAETQRQIDEFQREYEELSRRYRDFKFNIERVVENQGVLRQFIGAGDNPKDPNFWRVADYEILRHPLADLNLRRNELAASVVVDCRTPARTTPPVSPPAAPAAPPNPLAGLRRPSVPALTVPPAPQPFCTEQARRAWIDANVEPAMRAIRDAVTPLRDYGAAVFERLAAARSARPVIQDAVRALEGELAWQFDAHGLLDRLYAQLREIRDATTVIDCTGKGDKRVGVAPRPFFFGNPWSYVLVGGGTLAGIELARNGSGDPAQEGATPPSPFDGLVGLFSITGNVLANNCGFRTYTGTLRIGGTQQATTITVTEAAQFVFNGATVQQGDDLVVSGSGSGSVQGLGNWNGSINLVIRGRTFGGTSARTFACGVVDDTLTGAKQ